MTFPPGPYFSSVSFQNQPPFQHRLGSLRLKKSRASWIPIQAGRKGVVFYISSSPLERLSLFPASIA